MTSAADLPVSAVTQYQGNNITSVDDPLQTATGIYVTVHGHFYQPPRENPYLDAVERQAGAAPFHDWNERIHHECYRPNAFARVLDEGGGVVGIVNNYEYLSFNIGATLMSWLERYDVEVYQRIVEADRQSCARLNGHGNAIAQVYNHIIMPLANERDKHTQIRWGKEDFKSRFKRDPEGMWLAEAAVDYATIVALIAENIRFIVLAPSQAQRCRMLPTPEQDLGEWYEVGGSQIDATRPYRCFLPGGDPNKDYIDIFFYDGPISRDMGFNDDLYSADRLSGRIGQAVRGDHRTSQLISVATDGETFGHHKKGTEKTLAYAFLNEFPHRNWTVTNYAHYLSINPPTWEVELKPVTAWSCAHGVDRWQDDCGCGGEGGVWHQKWRKPLRESLDWLRDQLVKVYEETGKLFFRDPWLARDEYIQVMRDRSIANVSRFLNRHQSHKLTALEQVDALRLLEMQRHALLMYTSCGWFFEEISRPEGTQILRYAARALELAGDVAGVQLEKAFIKRLTQAPSNVEVFKHGAEIYRQLVVTAQIGFRQVAAQYAISSLFGDRSANRSIQRIYCYTAHQVDYQVQRMGSLTLAVGQLRLVSDITWESQHLVFAVLHLGGWDFHCCIQPFTGRRTYSQLKEKVFGSLEQASAAQTILAINQVFGDQTFSLQNLFAEERHRIMELLSHETLTRLDQLYTQVYRDNYGVLMAFHRDQLTVPQELQVAAEIALKHRCVNVLKLLWEEVGEPQASLHHLAELEATATEAKHLYCNLHIPGGKQTMEQLILRSLWQLLHDNNLATVEAIQQVERLINVGNQLNLGLCLGKSQELYFSQLSQIVSLCRQAVASQSEELGDFGQLQQLLHLGQKLGIGVNNLLEQLA
ncbi:MAG: DUF3536 domain-containing protein [Chroococcus sp. CMT-3BRIN-NPC107]|jgi:alpha-amylase/alpha-mannosidase (GH57 family)|nr:DUF3536 domain-containing protein [Chroococcus sp. CMT-3BRIN-NPC107]